MKKSIILLFVPLFLGLSLPSCNNKGGSNNNNNNNNNESNSLIYIDAQDDKSFSLDFYEKSLLIYEDFNITVYGKDIQKVEWKSSNEEIASVDNGKVIALKTGHVSIVATVNENVNLTCEVSVVDYNITPYIVLNTPTNSINLEKDDHFVVRPSISYNGLNYQDGSFTFSCSDSCVSINDDGEITALEIGQANISISASWRGNESMDTINLEVNVL